MTFTGRAETRPSKAGTLLRKDKERSEQRRAAGPNSGDCQLTGARASAAARSRGHSAWGKRHIPKAARAGFSASPASRNPGTLVHLSNVTKVMAQSCMLRPLITLICSSMREFLYAGDACKMLVFCSAQWVSERHNLCTHNFWYKSGQATLAAVQLECLSLKA